MAGTGRYISLFFNHAVTAVSKPPYHTVMKLEALITWSLTFTQATYCSFVK